MPKPKTRGECLGGRRPCLHLSCRYHLIWEHVSPDASDEEILDKLFELEDTCVLDITDRGPQDPALIAEAMNMHRATVYRILENVQKHGEEFEDV